MARAAEIVAEAADDPVSVFSTQEQTRTSDEWFLSSGAAVRCFFEEEAFDADGELVVPLEQSINKIGHAQHDLDDTYDRFARADGLRRHGGGAGAGAARCSSSPCTSSSSPTSGAR